MTELQESISKFRKAFILFFYKICKFILYTIITVLIFVFAIFVITFFGFNYFLFLLNKFINKLL